MLLKIRISSILLSFESFFEDEFSPDLKLLVSCLLLLIEPLLFLPFLVQVELEVGLLILLHFEQFLIFVGMLDYHFGHHLKLLLLIELLVCLLHKRHLLVERDLCRYHVGCAPQVVQSFFLRPFMLPLDVVQLAVHQQVIVCTKHASLRC